MATSCYCILYSCVAGEYSEHTSEYSKNAREYTSGLNEYYFLTDPEYFLFTHFPVLETEPSYNRWQLVERPITLDQFNANPHLSPMFFELGLEIVESILTPWVVQDSAVLRIQGLDVIRYKVSMAVEYSSIAGSVLLFIQI